MGTERGAVGPSLGLLETWQLSGLRLIVGRVDGSPQVPRVAVSIGAWPGASYGLGHWGSFRDYLRCTKPRANASGPWAHALQPVKFAHPPKMTEANERDRF